MKKIFPIIYLLIGLAFVAQGAGLIPLMEGMSRWLPLAVGWCFIILGVLMAVKLGKNQKPTDKVEPSETESTGEPS